MIYTYLVNKEGRLYGLFYYICTYKYNGMDTKLTLKLNQKVIEKAKEYASDKKLSLSRIVESYLQSLVSAKNSDDFEISPFVKTIATGNKIPADLDYKKEYSEHLSKKYK